MRIHVLPRRCLLCVLLLAAVARPGFAAQEAKILFDFEQPAEVKAWEFKQHSAALSAEHATHGKSSLKINSSEYMNIFQAQNWSGFDALEMDIFVEGSEPAGMSVLIGDKAWQQKNGSYWNRHNSGLNLKPGANAVSIPVNGLFRGEAGSRNNDIKSNIDPSAIVRFDLGFKSKHAEPVAIYIDHMRLVKESRPAGILAYDFGPPNQVLFPGFTPVTYTTIYGKNGVMAGLQYSPGANSARDDGFPSRLYQDYVSLQDNQFIADVPDGKYHVWVMYDDCGYWGGEQARFSKRWIEAGGVEVSSEKSAPTDYLYRFENLEPRPGDKLWDLYMASVFAPKCFETTVTNKQLKLIFRADGVMACKVAGIIIYADAIKAEAEKWVAEVEARNRGEFEARAICMGPKARKPGEKVEATVLGFPQLETEVTLLDLPIVKGELPKRFAARGQSISYTFSVTAADGAVAAPVQMSAEALAGPARIPASQVELRYVHQALHRGFNDIAYTIGAEGLRQVEGSGLRLNPGETRQFWITVRIPENAVGGEHGGTVKLEIGAVTLSVPYKFEVLDFALDEPEYIMGFYGVGVPAGIQDRAKALRELFTLLKEYGMNSFAGGPGVRFSGLDENGAPKLDFAACDEYMRSARECGFTKPLVAYGGPGMVEGLHDSYIVGETGRAWEKKTGKPFSELLKLVWGAVKAHAEKENWLPIYYEMNDEPRVAEAAIEQLQLQKLYAEAVPYVNIGGSYSVNWKERNRFDSAVQETFRTLRWSALNEHSQIDLEKAKEFGRELQIYNQGVTRYSFGAYQWAEFRKGVRGRMQWHLLSLHGYQFFDLDGREPDSAMINWGRNGLIPTIKLARCREGADDFRYAVTLWNLAQKKKASAEGRAALQFLDEVSAKIGVGQNQRPGGFMDDETFRNMCVEHIRKLR